jgi:glucan phosphoethanolaminetransferase (alkaline phosphatase superfamily)
VLEYQRIEKRRKRAVGGLLLLSGFLFLIGLIGSASAVLADRSLPFDDPITFLWILMPITLTGIYFAMAILFHRRIKWAGWVALVISAILFLGMLAAIAGMIYTQLTETNYDSTTLLMFIDVIVLLIAMGPAAVTFEIWWALREPSVWVEQPT